MGRLNQSEYSLLSRLANDVRKDQPTSSRAIKSGRDRHRALLYSHTCLVYMRDSSASTSEFEMPSASLSIGGDGDGGEIMWGRLLVVGKAGSGSGEQRVIVKVYRTSLEHFAIVYPDKSVANACGCLNLKNSRAEAVDNCDCSFRIVQKSCDAPAIQFKAESEEKRNVWLAAMYSDYSAIGSKSCRTNSHGSVSLPVVVEEDEEE